MIKYSLDLEIKMSKISVIIPVYNVSDCLSKCLDSVISQTYKNLEIICIDDASTDDSLEILKEYALKDSRIIVHNNSQNKGLSAVRNIGIDCATGDYLYFIDSDDWIDPNYIECLVNAAIKNNAEVVVNTNVIRFNSRFTIPHMPDKTYNNISDTFIDAKTAIQNIIWNTWTHLWKKSFIDRIHARFPEGYLIEDIYFQAVTYPYLDKIYVIRNSVYHHMMRQGSIMLKLNRNEKFSTMLKIMDLIYEFYEKNDLLDSINFALIHPSLLYPNEEEKKELQKFLKKIEKVLNKIKNYYPTQIWTRIEELLG